MTDVSDAIRRHRGWALRLARSWARRLPANVQREDIEQAALIGLFEWKKAHPDEAAPGWLGGLKIRIYGSIRDELRRQDWMPRRRGKESPFRVVGYDDADPSWEARCATDVDNGCDEALAVKQTAAAALRAPLIDRDADVVQLVYFEGLPLKEVANRFAVSGPSITLRHGRALGVMRAQLVGDVEALNRAKRGVRVVKAMERRAQRVAAKGE